MKDCKIVQDLLPNYIENLTTEATNQFINEHLNTCDECKTILNNMKEELKYNLKEKVSKKEVNYLKKYNRKLRIFMGIVFAIIVVFVVCYIRKLVIFNDLQNKLDVYKNTTNYYMKVTEYYEGNLHITQKFQKDDKYMQRVESLSSNKEFNNRCYRIYGDSTGYINEYCVSEDGEKYSQLNLYGNWTPAEIPDYWIADKETSFKYLKMVLFASITTEKCNEKDCYKITKRYYESDSKYNFKEYIYIEKKTGLVIRSQTTASREITDYNYSFGSITDKTLQEPDISEYTVIDENYVEEIEN